jgi:CO/xanthine dehydrogenase Mo-binding subunit
MEVKDYVSIVDCGTIINPNLIRIQVEGGLLQEIGIDTPPAAIANAIYNACGVRIRELPITPEKVLMELKKYNGIKFRSKEV